MIPDNLSDYYRLHARFFDMSRWSFLFGRNSLPKLFPTLRKQAQILDLGCGTGKHLKQLVQQYPQASITGIDLSEDMMGKIPVHIKERVDLINEEYTIESFEENQFDLILASYSLSMFSELNNGLIAIKKHLKPDGYILVLDFDSTPHPWFSTWMAQNHVHFKDRLFKHLKEVFATKKTESKKAYFGLYTYTAFLGINSK